MSADLVWRTPTLDDIPAITQLVERLDAEQGTCDATLVTELEYRMKQDGDGIEEVSQLVLDDEKAVGAGWIRTSDVGFETRYHLNVFADQAHPPLTGALASWLVEKRPSSPAVWRFDRVIAPSCEDLPARDRKLYADLGFKRVFLEHEMLRSTAPVATEHLTDIELAAWTPGVHGAIREAYNAAFAERNFGGYTQEEWERVFRVGVDDFRPNLTFTANENCELVGYVFATVLEEANEWIDPAIRGLGWIDSIGVRPSHSGRGIATALISRTIAAMREAGLKRVGLRVNDDNARALSLYERIGFTRTRKHIVYRRELEPDNRRLTTVDR